MDTPYFCNRIRPVRGALCAISVVFALAACGGGGGGSSSQAAPAPTSTSNSPPQAAASVAPTVSTGKRVILDGSASRDPDGDSLTYLWSFNARPSASTASLDDPTSVQPSFTPDVEGDYVVKLVVTDSQGASDESSSSVTADATPRPSADAGIDRNVTTSSLVTLDGSASSATNGGLLSYSWRLTSRPSGSNATLSGTDTVSPSFTPDVDGTYDVELIVSEAGVDSTPERPSCRQQFR